MVEAAVCCCDGNGTVECWQCHGDGGWHDCGEDTCPCVDQDEMTETCDECGGRGFFVCPVCAITEEDAAEACAP